MTNPVPPPPIISQLQRAMVVLRFIGEGRTLSDACDCAGMSYFSFRNALEKSEELQNLYVEAEQRSYDMMADALINIDKHHLYGQQDAKMASIVSANIKWYLSKRRSNLYGDKVTVEHTITADKAILDALERAKARAQGQLEPPKAKDVAGQIVGDIVDIVYK